jgi:hypothetical protein
VQNQFDSLGCVRQIDESAAASPQLLAGVLAFMPSGGSITEAPFLQGISKIFRQFGLKEHCLPIHRVHESEFPRV